MMGETREGEPLVGAPWVVESGSFRLQISGDAQGRVVLGGQVRRDDKWELSAPPLTSPVTGIDLTLGSGTMRDGVLSLQGTARAHEGERPPTLGKWQGSVAAESEGWIRVEVVLEVLAEGYCRPELLLWLGAASTMYERQTATFRQTCLPGPTVNSQGLAGNDLPAVFFYDPAQRVQTMLYVPAEDCTWSSGRFLDYRCDLCVDRATSQYGVGLVSSSAPGALLPGLHHFVWYVRQQAAATIPAEPEAQRLLITALKTLLGPSTTAPPSWQEIAAGTLGDLLTPGDMQLTVNGFLGHPAYVRDTSQIRAEDRRPQRLELMTQIDVIPPLALYLQLLPDPVAGRHLAGLIDTLRLFYQPDERWFRNFYPGGGGAWIEDLWYFFENALIKLPWTAAITGQENLWTLFLDALAGATTLAHNVRYIFPLFAEVRSKKPFGSSTNYSVGGMYAYGHLLAHAHTGREEHLDEAYAALATLGRLPVDRMWHEPQQLGFAAAAAALLSEQRADPALAALAEDLLATQLRMVYWNDRSLRGDSITGMFQACASLLYPAFKENVESILPWPQLLRSGIGDASLLLRILDAQRRNNGAYFDAIRGGEGVGRFIPYENLGTVELPQEGQIGKEIYGAGEVFWLYLLCEALGRADGPDILICSLDLPDLGTLAHFPPHSRRFMLFNSSASARTATLTIPFLPAGRYAIRFGDQPPIELASADGALTIPIQLRPGEAQQL
ncbi:MAG: hypothetical protein M3Z66_23950, partial [Chloroflexota bacterium]|nr:hypothetical protein [Chloroflexota bacterium]